jgi:hypothetical protein
MESRLLFIIVKLPEIPLLKKDFFIVLFRRTEHLLLISVLEPLHPSQPVDFK